MNIRAGLTTKLRLLAHLQSAKSAMTSLLYFLNSTVICLNISRGMKEGSISGPVGARHAEEKMVA
jgi:hypothetical protein